MTEENEHELIAERRRKLQRLREKGPAYPNDFRRDALADQLHAMYEGHDGDKLKEANIEVAVAGRMMAKRVMGKVSFVKLQDRSGQIQIFLARDELPDGVYQDFKGWDLGDIVAARGPLFKTKTGELSVRAVEFRLLSKCLRPLPEKFHGLQDQETRYRQRYLDLVMNSGSRKVFEIRTQVVSHIRKFLDSLNFMEVETPMMQSIPGGAVARPFITHHNALDMELYLRIAPELYLKRLVVGGFERVYEVNRNFRNEGLSTQHNPEFTMLELYQAYADCEDIMALTETLIHSLADALHGQEEISYQGETIEIGKPFQRVTVEQAVIAENPQLKSKTRDRDVVAARCVELGLTVDDGAGTGKLLFDIFEKTVEDKLRQPTFVTSYPAEISPLSRSNDADPFLADRFELFIAGREIANGFSELNDPEEQAARFKAQVALKDAGDHEAMFYDADYIRALEVGMPPAGGLGVGIDRLVMLLTDSASIRDVVLFPHMRPER
jgi:lysyl-tRNA synthetase class 2